MAAKKTPTRRTKPAFNNDDEFFTGSSLDVLTALLARLPDTCEYAGMEGIDAFYSPDFADDMSKKGNNKKNLKLNAVTKVEFVVRLVENPSITAACKSLGISKPAINAHCFRYPLFSLLVKEAIATIREKIEDAAYERAVLGVEKGIWWQGERVGEERQFSDQLLITLLKANMPEKYNRPQGLEVSGPDGGPIELDDAKQRLNDLVTRHASRKTKD